MRLFRSPSPVSSRDRVRNPQLGMSVRAFRLDRRWLLLLLLLALLLLAALVVIVVALLNGGSPPPAPIAVSDLSPYEQLWAKEQPDGTVDMDTALQAFALAIAPLPGVTPPAGAQTPMYERMDGTFAVDWITPYLDQLTPDQRTAVDTALAPDPNAHVYPPDSSGLAPRAVLADATLQAYYEGFANIAKGDIHGKLGRSLGIGYEVTVNKAQEGESYEYAVTYSVIRPILGASTCDIHVNPLLQNSGDEEIVRATMAHEMFHCYQFDLLGHMNNRPLPDWIKEGQAEWAGESVGGPSGAGAGWWNNYLQHPERALGERGYDALGFYQHLAEEGIDPWGHFDQMITAYEGAGDVPSANTAAFKAAGAQSDPFLDTWASGLFKNSTLGPEWSATGPWAVPNAKAPQEYTLTQLDVKAFQADVVLNQYWTITSAADVVELRSTGHVRLHTSPSARETDTSERWLCTKSGGCDCPSGAGAHGPGAGGRGQRLRARPHGRARWSQGQDHRPHARRVLQDRADGTPEHPVQDELPRLQRRSAPAHRQPVRLRLPGRGRVHAPALARWQPRDPGAPGARGPGAGGGRYLRAGGLDQLGRRHAGRRAPGRHLRCRVRRRRVDREG